MTVFYRDSEDKRYKRKGDRLYLTSCLQYSTIVAAQLTQLWSWRNSLARGDLLRISTLFWKRRSKRLESRGFRWAYIRRHWPTSPRNQVSDSPRQILHCHTSRDSQHCGRVLLRSTLRLSG